MKAKVVLTAIVGLACAPALAFGGGRLALHSDAALTKCTLSDTAPGPVKIYVADWGTDAASGLRFRIAASAGFTGVWLSDASPFTTFGNSQTDFSVGSINCQTNFVVLTMTYQLYGTSTCSQLSVAAPPGFSQPICVDCSFGMDCSGLSALHVNCLGPFDCDPVAVEPTTWGHVKALYRN